MNYTTHVYLGPTLSVEDARRILPDAHYHSPIRCGDLLRLLRLKPTRVVIIDGIYEVMPAVWHKEIMLAMDSGVEVWGASSMGALRAAELWQFGMKGVGTIFHDFLSGRLNDDDEVAVLHKNEQEGFQPINDAMVNIRATLAKAYRELIISETFEQQLLTFCKAQFYPYRSLTSAILKQAPQFSEECKTFSSWLSQHGIVDVKKSDAVSVLEQVRLTANIKKHVVLKKQMPMTKFIASLIDYTDVTPMKAEVSDLEKELHECALHDAVKYRFITEVAMLLKCLDRTKNNESQLISNEMLYEYMQENGLYQPQDDFSFLRSHPVLFELYPCLCQLICLSNLSLTTVEQHIPAVSVYYDFPITDVRLKNTPMLRILFVLVFALDPKWTDSRLTLKKNIVSDHLVNTALLRCYTQEQLKAWSASAQQYETQFTAFVTHYMHITYVYHGIRDVQLGVVSTPDYFEWLYDALSFYHDLVNHQDSLSIASSLRDVELFS